MTCIRVDSVNFDIIVGDITRPINVRIPLFPTGVPMRDLVMYTQLDDDGPFNEAWLLEAGHVVYEYIEEHYPK
jgi:hypothetical protein